MLSSQSRAMAAVEAVAVSPVGAFGAVVSLVACSPVPAALKSDTVNAVTVTNVIRDTVEARHNLLQSVDSCRPRGLNLRHRCLFVLIKYRG